MNQKRILVIGSQGYLGSRLMDYLNQSGYRCVGADMGFFRNGVLYEPRLAHVLTKDARALDEHDIENFDAVIQLAGISNDPFGNLDREAFYYPTRVYALRIAKICKKLGIKFVFPSSCSVYGIAADVLDETGATHPQTPYSLNKLQIEEDLADISQDGFSPIALRLATVFGASPRIRFDVVINMLCGMAITTKRIILNSDGQSWRPHVDIEDVCEAFRCCIEWHDSGVGLRIFNVGRNDNNARVCDVASIIMSQVPGCELEFLNATMTETLVADSKIHDGVDSRTYRVNFDKIHDQLPGFSAKWSIERGVSRLLQELERLQLDVIKFKQRDFYRLQQLDYLHKTRQISPDMVWS